MSDSEKLNKIRQILAMTYGPSTMTEIELSIWEVVTGNKATESDKASARQITELIEFSE